MDEVKKIASLIVKYKDDRELVEYLFNDSFKRVAMSLDPTSSYYSQTYTYHNTLSSPISSCFKILIKLNLHKCMKVLLNFNLIEAQTNCIVELTKSTCYPYQSVTISKTPLHLAIEIPEAFDCFKLLCDNKYSDLNKTFNNGRGAVTALYLACQENNTDKMKLLLKNGADINSEPSVLMDATRRGNYEITHFLIENGVNTDITIDNETPLLLAAKGNFKEIMDLSLIHISEPTRPY